MQPKNLAPYLPVEKAKYRELIWEKISSKLAEAPSGH